MPETKVPGRASPEQPGNLHSPSEIYYRSADGLTLYACDYDFAGPDAPVLLCLHGLTRNSRDFSALAQHLCGRYRVICADQRGRGRSAYDPVPANYTPVTYVQA